MTQCCAACQNHRKGGSNEGKFAICEGCPDEGDTVEQVVAWIKEHAVGRTQGRRLGQLENAPADTSQYLHAVSDLKNQTTRRTQELEISCENAFTNIQPIPAIKLVEFDCTACVKDCPAGDCSGGDTIGHKCCKWCEGKASEGAPNFYSCNVDAFCERACMCMRARMSVCERVCVYSLNELIIISRKAFLVPTWTSCPYLACPGV